MSVSLREIYSPSSKYKAEVILRTDGLFGVITYKWYENYVEPYGLIADGWETAADRKILVDTEANATQIAIEELLHYQMKSLKMH